MEYQPRGTHGPQSDLGLGRGSHEVRVSYFQGPRDTVALVLAVQPPGHGWKTFDTNASEPRRRGRL